MTEQEWLASDRPDEMLRYIIAESTHPRSGALALDTQRKLRLFACACCRGHADRNFLGIPYHARLLEACRIGEEAADGVRTLPPWRGSVNPTPPDETAFIVHDPDAEQAAMGSITQSWQPDFEAARQQEAALLRCIFGNPWQAVTLRRVLTQGQQKLVATVTRAGFGNVARNLGKCPWLTPDVKAVATHIYEARAWELLPQLADALEYEAGCTDEAMLAHCRGWEQQPGGGWRREFEGAYYPHARGCHVVDLILGKE